MLKPSSPLNRRPSEWATLSQAANWIAWEVLPLPPHLAALEFSEFSDLDNEMRCSDLGEKEYYRACRTLIAYLAENKIQAQGHFGSSDVLTRVPEGRVTIPLRFWREADVEVDWVNSRAENKNPEISFDDDLPCMPYSIFDILISTHDLMKIFPPSNSLESNASLMAEALAYFANDAPASVVIGVPVAASSGIPSTAAPPSSRTPSVDIDDDRKMAPDRARVRSSPQYTTPYIELLERAITHFDITRDQAPKVEELRDWFTSQTIDGKAVSSNLAAAMATIVRLPERQAGGARRQERKISPKA